MHLKSLSMAGFKSFADRTRLEFQPGVSVVVGPNGSGKSNIVDAVAWALGAQATRGLRADKMEEVIFAGAAGRRPLGRAEATVLLDNADRVLPLDLDEVSITRRLYRDGEAEYEINGVGCRLLDVQELLSDGGIGRRQHLIVGQGRLDLILEGRGEQRRQIIEEAAGIRKHRMRKAKAERRLDRTDADILRLHDVLSEMKRRRRPLRRQAEAARRYDDVRDRLRAIRMWEGGRDLRRLRERAGELAAERETLQAQTAEGEARLAVLESEAEARSSEREELSGRLERAGGAAARLEAATGRLQGIASVARERSGAIAARIAGEGDRRARLEDEKSRLREELERASAEETEARQRAEINETVLRSLEGEIRSLAEQEAMPAAGAMAMAYGDLRSLEGEETRDLREYEDVRRRVEMLEAGRESEAAERERVSDQIRSTDELATAAGRVYRERAAARAAVQADWEGAEERLRGAEAAYAGAEAKAEALRAGAVGLANPQAAEAAAASPQVEGTLLDRLDVPGEMSAACAAALGGWAEARLVPDRASLGQVAASLKAAALGGLSLLTASRPGEKPSFPAREAARRWGVEALADRLGPDADEELAAALLGDVALVEGWAGGWDLVGREPGVRAVTPEGDLITRFGIHLADPQGDAPAALRAARREREAAEADRARARAAAAAAREKFEEARDRERAALEDLEALEAALAGAADSLDRITRAGEASARELERLQGRMQVLAQASDGRRERLGDLRGRIAGWESEGNEKGAETGGPQADNWDVRRRELAERHEEARRQRDRSLAGEAAAAERKRMLETRLGEIRRTREGEPVAEGSRERMRVLLDIENLARRALETVGGHVRSLRAGQVQARAGLEEADGGLEEARREISRLREETERAKERLGEAAVEAAEIRLRTEAAAESLRRDADASEEQALDAPRPRAPAGDEPAGGEPSDEELAEEARSLAAQLARMGPVNPLAVEEFQELEDRYRLITGQLSDLETSKADLRKVIKALDHEMESQFRLAFEDAARFYQRFFTVLFPGGTGRLSLTDPSQPLEGGVEVRAQPLGKKVGKLSLLSGGERSLAALAFLFAVFAARPAPFHILDEVDAALDDANLRRFLRLLGEFRGNGQLVVITHQQPTVQAADVLYGVTMEPGGSSQAVAKRMDDMALKV